LGIPPHEERRTEKNLVREWGPTLLALLLIYLVLNVFLPVVMSTRSPLMVVVSESMVPTLNIGDIIVVKGEDNYSINDIVVYRSPLYRKPIVHRIIAIKDGHYITKGDHNAFPDPGTIAPAGGITKKDIQGKVIFVIPKLGYPKYIISQLFAG